MVFRLERSLLVMRRELLAVKIPEKSFKITFPEVFKEKKEMSMSRSVLREPYLEAIE